MHRPKSDERTFYYEIHEGREDSLCERISEERNGVPSPSLRREMRHFWILCPRTGKTGLIRHGIAVLHSGQGWQCRHKMYQSWVLGHGIRQSMSRQENCLDNSPIENFFGLRCEYEYTDYHSFRKALEKYIGWYNSERIKLRLHVSPDQYQSKSSA